MSYLFQFEQDAQYALKRIPMIIRFRLDLCGVKLSIRDWSKFSRPDRQRLVDMRCDDSEQIRTFQAALKTLIEACGGDPASTVAVESNPAWALKTVIPDAVCARAAELSLPIPTLAQWAALSDLQRFALIKLTREGHENKNLPRAMQEFGLG